MLDGVARQGELMQRVLYDQWWVKVLVWALASAVWFAAYSALNARGVSIGVHWEPSGLWVPALVYPYVFGAGALLVLPLVWNWPAYKFYPMLLGFAVAMVVALVVYYFYPVVMDRREYFGSDLPSRLMRMVVGADDPANCFPSSHCMFAALGAWYVWAGGANRFASIACAALAASICLGTVLVGQHFWLDIPGGIATAFTGIGAARVLRGKEEQ